MTTYTLTGIGVHNSSVQGEEGTALGVTQNVEIEIVVPDGETSFSYTLLPIRPGDDFDVASIEPSTSAYNTRVIGSSFGTLDSSTSEEVFIVDFVATATSGTVLGLFFEDVNVNGLGSVDTDFYFVIDGAFPPISTAADWAAFNNSITAASNATGQFGPNVDISFTSLGATVSEDDLIIGTNGDNDVSGGIGSDTIEGMGGDDTIDGGTGQDELRVGENFSAVTSGSVNGTDVALSGTFGSLTVSDVESFVFSDQTFTLASLATALEVPAHVDPVPEGNIVPAGTTEDDVVVGIDDDDSLSGRAGNDEIFGLGGNDEIEGGIGFDTIYAGDGDDAILGNNGYDLLFGGAGSDTMVGNNGFDTMHGGTGDDLMYGGVSPDEMYGDSGDDSIYGQAGFDDMYGGDGNDFINGNAGADLVNGGNGNDTLEGGLNNDTINGDAGNDRISGSNGRDVLSGGLGDDNLRGNAGNDSLNGDEGNDTLNGGLGSDTFFFTGGGADVIADFQRRNDSLVIDLALLDEAGINLEDATAAELDAFFQVVNGNLLADLGNGNSLQINGITSYTQLIDDVTFEYL